MKPPLSASQLVSQNHIFHINFWFLKDKKVVKPGKNLILRKKPEISLSKAFWSWQKICSVDALFWVYIMHHSCLYDSAISACFVKISLSRYK